MASKKTKNKSYLLLAVVLTVAICALVYAYVSYQNPESEAARGGNGGGGKTTPTITLNQTDPHLGDSITFTTTAGNTITVNCFQGGLGNLVYAARQSTGTTFVLGSGSTNWQSGEAACVAYLQSREKLLASTSFTALGPR